LKRSSWGRLPKVSRWTTVAVRLSALTGQPGRFTSGMPGRKSVTLTAPVGLGKAAWMPPKAEQVPTQIVAMAPPQTSLAMSMADRPPTQQYTPLSFVGMAPSTIAIYLPL
jgi:hypothetical protein